MQRSGFHFMYNLVCQNPFIIPLSGFIPNSVLAIQTAILRVKCINYIGKGVKNAQLWFNIELCYNQKSCVIKRMRCNL